MFILILHITVFHNNRDVDVATRFSIALDTFQFMHSISLLTKNLDHLHFEIFKFTTEVNSIKLFLYTHCAERHFKQLYRLSKKEYTSFYQLNNTITIILFFE